MDQQPDQFKPSSSKEISSYLQNGDILILSNPPELKPNKESNYLGDTELESLKKEHADFDEKEQNIQMQRETVSSLEAEVKEDLKTNVEIENCEIVSIDSECSSGVGSNSNSSNDLFFGMLSKSKMEHEEHLESDDFSRPIPVGANTEKITIVSPLEQESLITSNNSEFSESNKLENDSKEIHVKDNATEKFSSKVLDGKANETEAKSTCGEAILKSNEVGDNPLIRKENSSSHAQEGSKLLPNLPYRNSANPFEVVVPFVGKKPDWGDIKPFPHRYDLARKMNRMKFEQDGGYIPKMSYHEMMRKRQARSKEEVAKEEQQALQIGASVAAYVAKNILIRILLQMQKENPDEEAMIRYFKRFLDAPVSPIAMLYIPQFVHTVMYVRGSPYFSYKVRKMAERCYYRVHVMFPIPEGYNFETVYTSEVKKFLPEGVEGLHGCLMEYDELDSPDESGDSAFSNDSESND